MVLKGLLPVTGISLSFIDDISSGTAEILSGFGFRSSVSTATNGDDIWSGTATTLPIPPQPGGQAMDLVSSSVQDKGTPAPGTGIRTVEIVYLDDTGTSQVEIVTLDGTNIVTTVANNIRFVQELHAESVGTNGAAVGTIQINATGVAATIYTQIIPGRNRASNTARMVPASKVCLIKSWKCTGGAAAGGKSADVHIRSTSDFGLLLSGIFLTNDNSLVFNSSTTTNFDPPIIVPAFGIIKCTSFATAAGADVSASWFGLLVNAPV